MDIAPKAIAQKTITPKTITPKANKTYILIPKAMAFKTKHQRRKPKDNKTKTKAPKAILSKTTAPKAIALKPMITNAIAPYSISPAATTLKTITLKA